MKDFSWMIGLFAIGAGAAQLLFRGRARAKDGETFKKEVVPYVVRLTVALATPCLFAEALLSYGLISGSDMLLGAAPRDVWAWLWLFLSAGSIIAFLSWIAFFDGARILSLHPYLLGLSVAKERSVRLGSIGFMLVVSVLLAVTLMI